MVASWWGACVRGDMRVGEIRACLSLSPPPTPTMYTKWTGWYGIEKAANTGKGGKFRVTAASTSGRLLTGQQQWTRSCCELIGGIDAPKALGQCNPELLWLISPYPAFPWCVMLKDKFLLSPRSVKWLGIPRSLQLRFFSTFHEKRLCNKTLNTFEWLSSKHEYPAFCYFKNYCLYMRGLSHKICH